MKKILLFLILIFGSCSNIKTTLNDTQVGLPEHAKKMLLQKLDGESSDKSVLVFTAWFEKDTIRVLNNNKIIKEDIVNTTPQTGLGGFQVVSNKTPVEVQILSNKVLKFYLNKQYLQKYKFVYISRNVDKRNKLILEYSNKWKGFI